jgi:hypothetical protein
MVLLCWVLASLLVGYLGRNRRLGMWGYAAFALIFSPIIAAISLFAAQPSRAQVQMELKERDRDLLMKTVAQLELIVRRQQDELTALRAQEDLNRLRALEANGAFRTPGVDAQPAPN